MSFIISTPESAPTPAVRTDSAKYALLQATVSNLLESVPRETPITDIDIFSLAVTVRGSLPEGLAADDFDGNDLQQVVTELLGV